MVAEKGLSCLYIECCVSLAWADSTSSVEYIRLGRIVYQAWAGLQKSGNRDPCSVVSI
jgi:hypothetical protein